MAELEDKATPVNNNDGTNVHPPPPVVAAINYVKPFSGASKIESFQGKYIKRWQERVYSVLDMHSVAHALTQQKSDSSTTSKILHDLTYANKVCRHTILNTLSNELFGVYCSYKETNKIWESLPLKYTTEIDGREKFFIGNYYRWEMTNEYDIKTQINEYHKLLEDLKAEKSTLSNNFIAGLLIENLLDSWNDYKHQLKHKNKQLSLALAPNAFALVASISFLFVSSVMMWVIRSAGDNCLF